MRGSKRKSNDEAFSLSGKRNSTANFLTSSHTHGKQASDKPILQSPASLPKSNKRHSKELLVTKRKIPPKSKVLISRKNQENGDDDDDDDIDAIFSGKADKQPEPDRTTTDHRPLHVPIMKACTDNSMEEHADDGFPYSRGVRKPSKLQDVFLEFLIILSSISNFRFFFFRTKIHR
jgi:hypothetical protein